MKKKLKVSKKTKKIDNKDLPKAFAGFNMGMLSGMMGQGGANPLQGATPQTIQTSPTLGNMDWNSQQLNPLYATPPVAQQPYNINVDPNQGTPNITAPEVSDMSKQPNNFWQDLGQGLKNSNKDIKIPAFQSPFNNFYLNKGAANLTKAAQKGAEGLQSFLGMQNGGKLPKAQFGMGQAEAIVDWANSAANLTLAGINNTKGVLDIFGNANVSNNALMQEAQKQRQFIFQGYENMPPTESFGYGTQGRNPAFYAHGGITDYKSMNTGGVANVETENLEVAKLPNGLIDTMYGDTHATGGIEMMLPSETKIFSEKLKDPISKKSYAKMAKKFETEKDIENKDSKYSDYINKETAEMNINIKNQAAEELFAQQEMNKLLGVHNSDIQKQTQKEYQMKHGGKVKYEDGGKKKSDNNPTLVGQKGIGKDIFKGDLDAVYANAKRLGYSGSKDISSLQQWAKTKNPREVADYMLLVKPNKKAEQIWKEKYSKDAPVDMLKMSPEDRLAAFSDDLWDFRFPKLTPGEKPTTAKTPIVTESDTPIIPQAGVASSKSGFNFGKVNFSQPLLSGVLPNNYARDPITTYPIEPQYVKPRYLDIQPQLNQINRGTNALGMNMGSRTGSDIANLLQAQTNAYGQQGQVFGQKYNYDRGQDQWAEGINSQMKVNTDQFNLQNYIQNQRNPILQREGNIQMDKNNRQSEQINALAEMQHEQAIQDYLAQIYDPNYASANLFQKQEMGGKVKKKRFKKKINFFH